MLSKILNTLFGSPAEREIKRLLPLLEAVRAEEVRISALPDDRLRAQTCVFRERLAQGATLDDLLPEAFATVREAAKRVVGMRHFDVQVLGGIVLHQGSIAEMATGEGKTLVATLPLYLNALDGQGVHLVTVNDYLARRDSEWMGAIFEHLGLTVGLIQSGMAEAEKQAGYRADITYGTNNEFGFDYLRDNMEYRPEDQRQRKLNYAIIDEVDSILIDEARTPLIISGQPMRATDKYAVVDDMVRRLSKDKHFELDEKHKSLVISDEGMEVAEQILQLDNLYTNENIPFVHMIEQSIKAHHFFKKDVDYIVRNGEILIVDEFTGRTMEGRRYSDGLHQALEAKERVPVKFELQTIASITYQNFFRLYNKIAGMTGTAVTEAMEFAKIYNLEVVQVPTNLPMIREDQTDLIFATEMGKYKRVVHDIAEMQNSGRPVLVGTVSIEKSELIASLLEKQGVAEYQILNAKHHEREAAIIGNAGKQGAITIATNMAGRGTDIKLAEGVRESGGLCIIGTERHESRRIDNQLRGRAGRQGDPGNSRFYVSLEDEIARLFGGNRLKALFERFKSMQQEMDDQPLDFKMVSNNIERAQRQVEEYNYEIRKHVFDYDVVMDKQRKYIYGLRNAILRNEDVRGRVYEMFDNLIGDTVDAYAPQEQLPDSWDMEGLETELRRKFTFEMSTDSDEDTSGLNLEQSLCATVKKEYQRREKLFAEKLRDSYLEQGGQDNGKIDFMKLAQDRMLALEKTALLKIVTDKWIDHLYEMDYLRESVRLRAFGQKDPLLEYKKEGFDMFQQLIRSIEESVVQTIFRLNDPELFGKGISLQEGNASDRAHMGVLNKFNYVAADKEADRSFAAFDTSRFALAGQQDAAQSPAPQKAGDPQSPPKVQPVRVGPKVSPNDPCPCGSGKKYKKCCGSQIVE